MYSEHMSITTLFASIPPIAMFEAIERMQIVISSNRSSTLTLALFLSLRVKSFCKMEAAKPAKMK